MSCSVTRQKTQLHTHCCENLKPNINYVLIDLRATRDTAQHKVINLFSLNMYHIVIGFVVLFHISQIDFCLCTMNSFLTSGKECIKVWSEVRLKPRDMVHFSPASDHDKSLFGRVRFLGSRCPSRKQN